MRDVGRGRGTGPELVQGCLTVGFRVKGLRLRVG